MRSAIGSVCETAGRGRGSTAPVGSLETTGSGLIAKIGAGCGPDCMNRPLTRINPTAATAINPPKTSRRWLATKRSTDGSRAPMRSASVPLQKSAIPPMEIISCTFLYGCLETGRGGRERRSVRVLRVPGTPDLADRFGGAPALAIEREPHGHPRALAEAAAHVDFAAMQFHQPLDDGEPEAGAVVGAGMRSAHLEERIAEPAEVLGRNADAGVLHRHHEELAVDRGVDRHGAAAVGELERIGDEVDQYLLHGALVGDDLRQLLRHFALQRDAEILRFEGE